MDSAKYPAVWLIFLQTPSCRSHHIQLELCLLPQCLLSCPSLPTAWGSCCPRCCDRVLRLGERWTTTTTKCEATSFSSSEKPSWVCFLYGSPSPARGLPVHPPLQWSPILDIRHQFRVDIQCRHMKEDPSIVCLNRLGRLGAVRWYPCAQYCPPPPCCPNTCASQMRGDQHPCPSATLPPLGLSPPKHKVQRAIQPPPDHESQMNPRIKDTPLLHYPFFQSLTPLLNWLLCSLPTSWDVNTLCSCSDSAVMLSEMERPPPHWIRQENDLNMAAVTRPSAPLRDLWERVYHTFT